MRLPTAARALLLAVAPLLVHCAMAPARPAAAPLPTVPFRSAAGGYHVQLVSQPNETSQRDDKTGLRLHLATAVTPDRALAEVVAWCDEFPEARSAPDRIFAQELAGMQRPGDEGFEEHATSFDGMPGHTFSVRRQGGKLVTGRMFLHDARLFVLIVTSAGDGFRDAAEAFFHSFVVEGPGRPDAPPAAAARRVSFPEAKVALDMHADPERAPLPAATGLPPGRVLAARSRGGLRIEIAIYQPLQKPLPKNRKAVLDGVYSGVTSSASGVSDVRDVAVEGRPAREFRSQVGNMDAYNRLVILDDGALLLQLVAPPGAATDAEAAAYFRSMKRG